MTRESERKPNSVFKLGRKSYQIIFEDGKFEVRENGKTVESTYASATVEPVRYDWKGNGRLQ